MGAFTASIKATIPALDHEIVIAELTGSSSYDNDPGDTMAASEFGLSHITAMVIGGASAPTYSAHYSLVDKTITVWLENVSSGIEAELGNAVDISGVTWNVIAVGKGS